MANDHIPNGVRQSTRGMQKKIKNVRSADCVVGGFDARRRIKKIGSLLLGLYDGKGLLNHVGFNIVPKQHTKSRNLTRKLQALSSHRGLQVQNLGGPSRWSTKRSAQWEPVKPKLVLSRFVTITLPKVASVTGRNSCPRPDKAPRQCTMERVK